MNLHVGGWLEAELSGWIDDGGGGGSSTRIERKLFKVRLNFPIMYYYCCCCSAEKRMSIISLFHNTHVSTRRFLVIQIDA